MLIGCKNIHLLLIFKSEFNGPRNVCHKYKCQASISRSAYLMLASSMEIGQGTVYIC